MAERLVVRGFGYDVRHVVDVPASAVALGKWIEEFDAVYLPLVALCGANIRSYQAVVVVMSAPATCRHCVRLSRSSGG